MNPNQFIKATLVSGSLLAGSAFSATVITDPALVTTGNKIAPYAAINTPAPGSTAESTLEALSAYAVLQDFTGFVSGSNTLHFSAEARSRPDVQITFAGASSTANTGKAMTNNSFLTSSGSGMQIQLTPSETDATSFTATIDFGEWNAASSTFNGNANNVNAAGFTLRAALERFALVSSITARFYSADGNILSTQSITANNLPTGAAPSIHFGYQAAGNSSISSIILTVDMIRKEESSTVPAPLFGFDDLGFTTIAIPVPEPAAIAWLGGLVMMAAAAWQRCRR
ncbi:MAG: hypothetical protein LBK99_24945 [Opitutaceae bacterium]|jgi:hypothetical protein|nr:hypothetical protein [Opitutaceae bacterium]